MIMQPLNLLGAFNYCLLGRPKLITLPRKWTVNFLKNFNPKMISTVKTGMIGGAPAVFLLLLLPSGFHYCEKYLESLHTLPRSHLIGTGCFLLNEIKCIA